MDLSRDLKMRDADTCSIAARDCSAFALNIRFATLRCGYSYGHKVRGGIFGLPL